MQSNLFVGENINNGNLLLKKCCTYNVWIFFRASNVPLANDWMLLSYRDNKLRLCRSLKASLRMQVISFAFRRSNWREERPLNTPAGSSLILLPYKTLWLLRRVNFGSFWMIVKSTYSEVMNLSPENASCEIFVMLLLDRSILRNFLLLENAFGGTCWMRFCSNRL